MSDAEYDETIDVDLSAIEPLIALPHSPDHVRKVSEVEGLPINQIGIGSCTNSSYKDLMVAAKIFKDQRVHQDVSVVISPGSRRTLAQFSSDGGLDHLIKAGVRLLENTCGPCNGIGQSPESNGVSLRTYNRNFKGRSGTNDAQIYLVSTETAAVSALFGRITDPREFGRYPEISLPDCFLQIPNMFLEPAEDAEMVEIVRGPNIQPIPLGTPLPGQLEFPVELKLGDNITTDHILPGGAEMLSLRSNIPASIPYVFNRVDPDFAGWVDSLPQYWAVVAGENYGQGSAREHAVMVPMSIGMKVIIAKSFARIYRQNMINNGIVPLVFQNVVDYGSVEKSDLLFVDRFVEQIQQGRVVVENRSRGNAFETIFDLNPRERDLILEGGLLSSLRGKASEIGCRSLQQRRVTFSRIIWSGTMTKMEGGLEAKKEVDPVTDRLAGFFVETQYEHIPREAIHEARRAILDGLGVSLGGVDDPSAEILMNYCRNIGGNEQAQVWGRPERLPAEFAALINGQQAHILDFDDTFMPPETNFHATAPLLPALMAVAEQRHLSGKAVLRSFVLGFDAVGSPGARYGSRPLQSRLACDGDDGAGGGGYRRRDPHRTRPVEAPQCHRYRHHPQRGRDGDARLHVQIIPRRQGRRTGAPVGIDGGTRLQQCAGADHRSEGVPQRGRRRPGRLPVDGPLGQPLPDPGERLQTLRQWGVDACADRCDGCPEAGRRAGQPGGKD